ELAAARRLEVEHGDELLALEDQVVVEEVAVDDALRQLVLEVVLEVIDLVVQRTHDAPEVARQPVAHLAVDVGDALVAEAVVDPLLVALADGVQVRQHATDGLEPSARETRRRQRVAVDVAVDREALAVDLAVVAALAIGERMRTREVVLAEEEEQ